MEEYRERRPDEDKKKYRQAKAMWVYRKKMSAKEPERYAEMILKSKKSMQKLRTARKSV
jgi:hypothetical protein